MHLEHNIITDQSSAEAHNLANVLLKDAGVVATKVPPITQADKQPGNERLDRESRLVTLSKVVGDH